MNTKLSLDQISQYNEKGYLVPDYQLPEATLKQMQAAYHELLEQNIELGSDFLLGPHLETSGTQGVKGSKIWYDFATHPDLVDMASQLIGEDIVLWGTTIFGKPAKGGKGTPWHQDGDYYPIRPLETMTIWIALDDVTEDNGPMSFIPGSHKGKKKYSHHRVERDDYTIFDVCDSEHFDESNAEDLIIKAGQVSYHDVYMIHGSKPNLTDHRRAAFIVRLMPASSHYGHELGKVAGAKNASHDYGYRPLFLVSGKDASGKNDFSIGH
jgi:hypothetical protein